MEQLNEEHNSDAVLAGDQSQAYDHESEFTEPPVSFVSVIQMFEDQVSRTPSNRAIQTVGQDELLNSVTYQELNQQANRIAHALLAERGTTSEPVIVLMEQGILMFAVILAVLKSGKFYVPLNTHDPAPRLRAIVAHSDAQAVITDSQNAPLARELVDTGAVLLEVEHERVAGRSAENLDVRVTPESYFNIMYTSGSTGEPKGVLQNHLNVYYSILPRPHMEPDSDERAALLVPLTFGGSVPAAFKILTCGATLCAFNVRAFGVGKLVQWLQKLRITDFQTIPTVYRNVLEYLEPGETLEHIRRVRLGGEPVLRTDHGLFKHHFADGCVLRVALGTTETYVATSYLLDTNSQVDSQVIPVGFADLGRQILLLDEDGLPLADDAISAGEIGEIGVKSRYISPGYWRKPELTQEAFLPDPLGSDQRIYRTGDLGRIRPDGALVHLGRKDFRVKIRGQQVVPSAVEMAIMEIDGVREVVVVSHKDTFDEYRLVAYVVFTDGGLPTPGVTAMRALLAESLPDYMVPSAMVVLDKLPRLSIGKVDRGALPIPEWKRPELPYPYVAPRTPIEETLEKIWVDALSIDRVGIHDRFLDLGGHSLQAARIVAKVIDTFDVELPIRELLESPTVADMTVAIAAHRARLFSPEELARMLDDIEDKSA